jgi:hypothetical protein
MKINKIFLSALITILMNLLHITLQCSKVAPPWNLDCDFIDDYGNCPNAVKSFNGKYFG